MTKSLLQIFAILALLIFAGCKGSFQPPGEEDKTAEKQPEPEMTDKHQPLGLKDDLVIIPSVVSLGGIPEAAKDSTGIGQIGMAGADAGDRSAETSYQIQLFTSKEYGPAIREKKIAAEVFDQPVSMDYEVPYYKIRVGDFASQDEADEYLPAAREAGYKTAWVVRTYANVRTIEDVYDGYNEGIELPYDSLELQLMEAEPADDSGSVDYDYQGD